MRASGRGGRQGPRGDRIPPRALLAFMGDVRAGSFRDLGGSYAKVSSLLGGFLCAAPSALWGIMNGYELAFALTSL